MSKQTYEIETIRGCCHNLIDDEDSQQGQQQCQILYGIEDNDIMCIRDDTIEMDQRLKILHILIMYC